MRYYWAAAGSDSNSGTSSAAPWQTLAKFATELAAGTFQPGDILSFNGGDEFLNQLIDVASLLGTALNPITINSYGSGKALFRRSNDTDHVFQISGSTAHVRVENISLEMPTGSGVVTDKSCLIVQGTASNIRIRDVDTLGGYRGIRLEGASSGRVERTNIRHAWHKGISVGSTAAWVGDDIEAYGVGYETDFSGVVGSDGEGVETADTASFIARDVRVIDCKRGFRRFGTSVMRFYRTYCSLDRSTQEEMLYVDGSAGTPPIFRDSIFFATYQQVTAFNYIEAVGDNLTLTNCTLIASGSNGGDTPGHSPAILGATGADITTTNCVVLSLDARLAHTEAGQIISDSTSIWFSLGALAANPFSSVDLGIAPFYLITPTAWFGAYSTSSAAAFTNPGLVTTGVLLGPRVAELASANSPCIGAGVDLTATYSSEGYPPVDYFGTERYPGLWAIGADEYPVPSIQTFTEGGSQAALTSVPEFASWASVLSIPPFPSFPAISHKIESTVQFSHGTKSIGIWGLGGQAGAADQMPIQPISTQIYQHTFDSGSVVSLDDGGRWAIGLTPGSNDPRGVFFDLYMPAAPGNLIEARLRSTVTASDTASQALSFSTVTSGLQSAQPNVKFGVDLKLTLFFRFIGRQPGPGSRNDYVYTIEGYIDDVLAVQMTNVVFPQGYIEGFDIDNVAGPAVYAGITGERSTFGSTLTFYQAYTSTQVWKTFYGSIEGPITGSIPSTGAGEARIKAYMGSRRSIPNKARNGGFGSFPREITVQQLVGAVEVIDPTYDPPSPELPLHVAVLINGTDSMDGGEKIRTVSFLEQMIRNLPLDGTIMLCMCAHRNTSSGTYGDVYPNVDLLLTNTVMTQQTLATAVAAAKKLNPGSGQERWASGLDAIHQLFLQGDASGTVGYNKMVLVIDDEGTGDVGIRRTECATQIDTIHALPGLVACDIFSVDAPTSQVVGRAVGEGSWDFIFPRPTVELPNQPLAVPTDQASTHYISIVTVPNTTSAALVARSFAFTGPVHTPPSFPMIQSPPLKPITSYPNNAGTHYAYAEWCGYTWAKQIVKRRDVAVLNQIPAGPPPVILRDAYQAWADLDAGYAFDIPSEAPTESLLGEWSVYGASGSLEVAPVDENDDVIPSRDGGNLVRVTFGQSGVVEMAQTIVDHRPFRGEYLTLAYSGRRFVGRVRVDLIVRVDGSDNIIDTAYSQTFGPYVRRVAVFQVPLNFDKLEVVIRMTGNTGYSVGLSGIKLALGRYAYDLPYSDALVDSVIPAGAVVMVTGDACPAGFRRVPDSERRLALATTGDPNFYAREFDDSGVTGTTETYDTEIDLVFLVDLSASQWSGSAKQTTLSWLQNILIGGIQRDGRVNVAIVAAADNIAAGSELILPLTPLTIENAAGSIQSAINQLSQLTAGSDYTERAIITARQTLESGNARWRMLLRNTDGGGYGFNVTATALTEFAAILAMPRFIESSAVIVNSTRATVLARNGEDFIYPTPSISSPGILFAATGGVPGTALPGSFNGQPYQAGLYAAEVMSARINEQVQFGISLSAGEVGVGIISRLGGQRTHEHAEGSLLGSSTAETDGFEDPLTVRAKTVVPIPVLERLQIKPYRFGSLPQYSRPEDRPVKAVGPNHQHEVATDMEALPPSFKVIFCEKL